MNTISVPDARVRAIRMAIRDFVEEAVRDDAVREIWARIDEDRVDVWVLTDPIDPDRELPLYESEDILHERLPNLDLQVHVEHSGLYDATDYVFRPAIGAELIRHVR